MKINKFLSALFFFAALGLSSCDKPEPEVKDPVLTVEAAEKGLSVANAGGTVRISYSVENPVSGETLSVSCTQEWVSEIKVTSSDVTLEVEANPGDSREATLKFSYPKAQSLSVKLTQLAAGEEIALSQTEADLSCGADSLEVTVTSDRDWTLSGGEYWVKASAESGKSGDKVKFRLEANPDPSSREAKFVFTCNTKTVTLTLRQGGMDVSAMIKDQTLKSLLMSADTDSDGKISLAEAAALTRLEYKMSDDSALPIMSLEGLEYFTGLETINLQEQEFAELNLSGRTALKYLNVASNTYLESVDLSGCTNLETVFVSLDKALLSVNLKGCSSLVNFTGYGSGLTEIDVRECPRLESLTVYSSNIVTLDVSRCTELKNLNAGCSTLTSVTLPENSKIETLSLSESSKLKSVDLSRTPSLKSLSVGSSAVTELAVDKCPLLETITMDFCKKITKLDVSHNMHLKSISAMLSGLSKVTMFEGQWDEIKDKCNGISLSMVTSVGIDYPADCAASITDSGLRAYVIGKYDTDGDGVISGSEAENVTEIKYASKNLTEFSGFEYFRHIKSLNLSGNSLTKIDLGMFASSLEELDLSYNQLTELSLSGTKALKVLYVPHNNLTSCTGLSGMDLSSTLQTINASYNKLTSFKCTYAKSLKNVDLSNNELTVCDLEYCSAIVDLNLKGNHLTEDTGSFVRPFTFTALQSIDVSGNDFVKMQSDVTWTDKWTSLLSFACNNCAKLQEVDLSYSTSLVALEATSCPRLECIYVSSSANPQITKDSTVEIIKK